MHRQGQWTARNVGVNRAEVLLEKAPGDGAGELRQRMAHVDDLIEPRPKQSFCPLSRRSFGRIAYLLACHSTDRESRHRRRINLQKNLPPAKPCGNGYFAETETALISRR